MAAASITNQSINSGHYVSALAMESTMSGYVPAAGSSSSWGRDYAATLGIVSIAQQAFTRTGSNLTLNPPLTPAFDQATIPYYNVYFSDTWHMKPTFTLTYGMGWTLEMPPVEKDGKQIELVDQANQLVDTVGYLHSRTSCPAGSGLQSGGWFQPRG